MSAASMARDGLLSTASAARAALRRSREHEEIQPPLEVVPRQRRTLRITTVALSVLAVLILFGLVGFQALIVSQQSTIDELDEQIDEAARSNQRLRLEVAELEAPERIRVAALTMLGMITPDEVIYLNPISADELQPVDGGAS